MSDQEFAKLIQLAKNGDNDALCEIINIFEEDIFHVSRFIRMSKEDAVQSIVVNLIEELRRED
ncbi:helix-turn-helix domain-containing protein [Paenibacillus pini]|uniref:Helix-turn-helix conjugative transposon-like domain-containing protein n=1 Tax=Paenibacillus pini JCM 16418 TaxID=1236976 RepID=W7Z2W1_9BACL|nr:helix-turn-helix domain-containing protein [Paenibacillus pini]GAF08784.1 hypothetical protein JCM16418_2889 [Paenibacillus pini JCM 16418]